MFYSQFEKLRLNHLGVIVDPKKGRCFVVFCCIFTYFVIEFTGKFLKH